MGILRFLRTSPMIGGVSTGIRYVMAESPSVLSRGGDRNRGRNEGFEGDGSSVHPKMAIRP